MSEIESIPMEGATHPACAMLDASMVILSVNRAWHELTGFLPEEVVAQSALVFFEDPTGLGLRVNLKDHPDQICALPLSIRCKSEASTRPVSVTLHPLHQVEIDKPTGYLLVATPTNTDNAMGNLGGVWLEPSEFVGYLVKGTAHKLNNLVTVFQGYTDMLLIGELEPDELQESLRQMSSASNGLVEIINRLLEVGGRASLDCRPTEVAELAESLHRQVAQYCADRVAFSVEMAPGLPSVFVDPKRLEQAIVELVRNACDAIAGKGTVKVRFSSMDNNVVITVEDSAPGLSEEMRTKIFRPYFTTKKSIGRLGIGLNAVTGLLSQMSGELQIHSEVGFGSEFRILLPAITPSAQVA